MFKNLNKPGEQKGMVLSQPKGFTLIELLIVVAIIGIIAGIAIPAYIGLQNRVRKVVLISSAGSAESELHAWLNSAGKLGIKANNREVDTNGDGLIDNNDLTNIALAALVTTGGANGLASQFVYARWNQFSEYSPWIAATSLWAEGAAVNGRVAIDQPAGSYRVTIIATDNAGGTLFFKTIASD